ncbi:MAG TPA: hypothetical protein VGL47_28590, partial [Amycolatopsis sp.]|uniref:hypothetical protein n=1 Tax=Amycolatopsis sp. TaxID=37632 RepID=UPI002F427341
SQRQEKVVFIVEFTNVDIGKSHHGCHRVQAGQDRSPVDARLHFFRYLAVQTPKSDDEGLPELFRREIQ